jgi:hypothetical protein
VIGVLELGFSEAFMVVNCAVSDELDLGLARDSFEIGVQNRLLGALGFVVAMSIRLGLMSALRSDLDPSISPTSDSGSNALVKAYCCSGVKVTSRNSSASCYTIMSIRTREDNRDNVPCTERLGSFRIAQG